MLKKTWLYSPFAQKKFERTTFRNAKNNRRKLRGELILPSKSVAPIRSCPVDHLLLRGRAEVARQAHNLEAVGSIPTPATNDFSGLSVTDGLFFCHTACVELCRASRRHGMRKSPEDERTLFEGKIPSFFYRPDPFRAAVSLCQTTYKLTIT